MEGFGAVMKYVAKKDGIDIMHYHHFESPQEYIDFILEAKRFKHFRAPVTQDEFYRMLGYYSVKEIDRFVPPEI